MPKTSKRIETKRAAKIARAHATSPPKIDERESTPRKNLPGYKPPKRGLARYPWAITIVVLLVALGVYVAYANHLGPFAPPKPKVVVSPCVSSSMVSKVTNKAAPLTTTQINAITRSYKQAPAMSINTDKVYCAGINTNRGLIIIELDPKIAPKTVNNFVFLAQHHFYDGLVFGRVEKSGSTKIIQGGDPLWNSSDVNKRGTGGPGYTFADEPVKGNYTAGTIAMANSGKNTNGSQFFINLTNNNYPKSYNLFGHIVQGMNVANQIQGPASSADPDYQQTKNIKPDQINYLVVAQAP
jgi:cyclophilin family peptidyl-prolyl cis-trans isomerase